MEKNGDIYESAYDFWFAALKLGDKKKEQIWRSVCSGRRIYEMNEDDMKRTIPLTDKEKEHLKKHRQTWNVWEQYVQAKKKGICFVTCTDPGYPSRLRNIPSYPYALFYKGNLPKETECAIAMVGARSCTHYGEVQSLKYAKALAERGVQIVSGMAYGIDGYCHRGAILAGQPTYAVLGCGVDVCYPKSHIGLYQDILKHGGGILSEQPPGTQPLPVYFPMRNRIISGLSDVVLVMEAREKSGSLITADMALEQGRDVYALPGPVDSVLSTGCNKLIRQGAGILTGVEELCEELHIIDTKMALKIVKSEITLETNENLVYSDLDFLGRSLEEIAGSVKRPVPVVISCLTRLQLKGLVKETSKNRYAKI